MTDYAAVLRELMLAGYEGECLLRAFERLCAAIGGGVGAAAPAAPVVAERIAERRRKPAESDRHQLNMMLPSDGGQAKAPPMTDAERQAVRRARRKNVTLRDVNARQVIENIEESRNVTEKRDASAESPRISGDLSVSSRDAVTPRRKKRSPHTPLRKTNPQNLPLPTVPWDSPLIPILEELAGKRFGRFGSGRTVQQAELDAAVVLFEERSAPSRLRAAG